MSSIPLWFDWILAGFVVGLAWSSLSTRSLRRSVVFFMALGSVLALVWARLAAPDLAIAEIAVGVGLTGSMLLATLRLPHAPSRRLRPWLVWAANGLTALIAAGYGLALWLALDQYTGERLADLVIANLERSGVSNPVTAVLLNFRAYDTLLEMAVLLAAVIGIRALGPPLEPAGPAGLMVRGLISWIVPALLLVGVYLLWVGAHAPGGAFQAGAVIASGLVLLRFAGVDAIGDISPWVGRLMLALGVGVFATVGVVAWIVTGTFLQYPFAWSGSAILFIETAATLSIALGLATALIGGDVHARESQGHNHA